MWYTLLIGGIHDGLSLIQHSIDCCLLKVIAAMYLVINERVS